MARRLRLENDRPAAIKALIKRAQSASDKVMRLDRDDVKGHEPDGPTSA